MAQTSKDTAPRLNRREFLSIGSGAVGVALASPPLAAADLGQELPTHRFRVRRNADLLSLEFSFVNFERRSDLLHALGAGRSLVIVKFPPQNLAEARFDKVAKVTSEPDPGKWPPPAAADTNAPAWEEMPLPLPKVHEANGKYSPVPPVASILSGPSWVVFSVPDATRIPLNLAAAERTAGPCGGLPLGLRSVLDVWLNLMGQWPVRVPTNAITPGRVGMPSSDETCLEIPFRLFIAPKTKTAKWITSSTPRLPFSGRSSHGVELWHAALHDRTRLAPATPPPDLSTLPAELAPPKRVTLQARAVFSPDYQDQGEPSWQQFYPGKLPLSHRALVRHLLVKQMMEEGDGWIDAEHLILSPLGADASLSYYMQRTFEDIYDEQLKGGHKLASRLAIWKHRMVVGRDVFLLSVWTGFLFPIVYPALLVELTRRSFVSRRKDSNDAEPKNYEFGPPGAYLLTEYFILAQDPIKQFSGSQNVLGRKMPIKKATLLETRSPLILRPDDINTPFVPQLLSGGGSVRWPIEFEDESGRRSKTADACLLFATNVVQGNKSWAQQPPQVRKWSLPAQRIGLAPDTAQLSAPAQSGQPAKTHPLRDEERAPAAQLATEFRDDLTAALKQIEAQLPSGLSPEKQAEYLQKKTNEAIQKQLKQLQQLVTQAEQLPQAARQAASRLQAETRGFIAQTIGRLNSAQQAAEDSVAFMLGQLATGERIASDRFDYVLKGDQAQKSAQKLANQLRQELAAATISAETLKNRMQGLPGSIDQFSQSAQEHLRKLEPAAQQKMASVIGEFTATEAVAQRAVETMLRQLSRAEQAAADVEVHAIELASRQVNNLLDNVDGKIRASLDQATSQAEFLERLKPLFDDKGPEFERLKGELNARWQGVQDNWQARRQEATEFLNELSIEAKQARDFLRHGFQPQLEAADVIVPALKAMGGTTGPQNFTLLEAYAAKGIEKVQNSVFGQFTKTIDDGRAMADRIKCAVASPAAQVAGLSRDLGALVGKGQDAVRQLAEQADNFDLSDAIPDFKLLGVLPLSKIVSKVLSGAQLPTIKLVTLPDHIEQIWEWNAKLEETDLGILKFTPNPPGKSGARIRQDPVHLYVKTTTRIDVPRPEQAIGGVPPKGNVRLEGVISFWNRATKKPVPLSDSDNAFAFSLRLLELIDIKFIDVSFDAEYQIGGNPNPKVKPRLGTVDFLPPLDFVKKLQELLPFLGKGFSTVQSPGRIGISYEFHAPAIAFGAFSMRNLAIGSSVLFSLEGKPLRFDFNFSSWEQPFELTVLCFGGRGFLKIAASTNGDRDLQGMLEFGGALSFDVVVASGGLYVMAGIYFRITPQATTVAGFFRAGGCLNVLGLIHASVEFLLMASYVRTATGSKLAGEASVTVSIDLFLVSFDVTIRMYKEFAGSGNGENAQAVSLDRSNPMRLVSLRQNGRAMTPPPHAPLAYFNRQKSPAANVPPVLGRFDAIENWNADYWSQFEEVRGA